MEVGYGVSVVARAQGSVVGCGERQRDPIESFNASISILRCARMLHKKGQLKQGLWNVRVPCKLWQSRAKIANSGSPTLSLHTAVS